MKKEKCRCGCKKTIKGHIIIVGVCMTCKGCLRKAGRKIIMAARVK